MNIFKQPINIRTVSSLLFASTIAISPYAYSNCTDSPVDGAIYKIVNTGSNLLLNVEDAATTNGANINTLSNTGNASQRFYLHYQSSSHYWTMEAAHTSMLVNVANASTSNGGNVIQSTADSSTSQEWELKQQSDGSYRIVNRNSSYSLTVAGSVDGANSYQNEDLGYSSQRWWLEPVSYSCGANATTDVTLSGSASDSTVSLSWNLPSDVNAVQVYYDTDSNPSGRSRLATLTTSTTSYTATNLTNGTAYWFWIKYRTTDNVWHNSNAFSATPSAGTSGSNTSVFGYGSSATGGAGGSTVTVSSCSNLESYLESSDTLTIQIPDNTTIDCQTSGTAVEVCKIACPAYQDEGKYTHRIPTSDLSCTDLGAESTTTKYRYDKKINVASNKTLIGLGAGSAIEGATLSISDKSNVIIKNLSIGNVNPDLVEGGDAVSIEYSDNVVVDHVKFSMISDGHVDIRNNSTVTLSYNEFDGYNPYVCANQHWYTNLVSDSKATFHHNFWNYTAGRNPKLTGSSTVAHLFNNYWLEVTYFSISASTGATALVEHNYFDDAARPHWDTDGTGVIDGNVDTNVYTGQSASGSYAVQDTGGSVSVPYAYSTEDENNMPNLVNEAGAQ